MKSSADIRQAFLNFFSERGHQVVSSSSLVPGNDPTLLFTNAGMVQFKDVFTGREKRPYTRATSSQRCVRAGGKHNDLENVGYTARHHTFFEMLGNFSFGDYFKHDAIRYAWEFLTEVVKLPPERLWVTVYEEDDEAADIWLKDVGVDPNRFSRIGAKDNFWSMGDTGPCGPCTEIFYDHGSEVAGGPPGTPEEDGDRYIEIWNLVFMQYDRSADGSMTPLPAPSVDTGMGLERLAAVVQGVHSNYEIDLFRRLIGAAAELAGRSGEDNSSLRVIADHIRACAFLIADGVYPSNEGRGYVLRRIVRRAIRHGYKLGIDKVFFYRLVSPLVDEMGAAYPELTAAREQVERVLQQEEERFRETLEQGMKLLDETLANLTEKRIPGETIFRLYDTYGFPVDLTNDVARERGYELDEVGFEAHMEAQRERARSASQFKADYSAAAAFEGRSEFTGYDSCEGGGKVLALYREGKTAKELAAGEEGMVILDRTPFYAESGGQVGDKGVLLAPGVEFDVTDTVKFGDGHGHLGRVRAGSLALGAEVVARVDGANRQATMLNHSATHLLHAALRQVLGEHVVQKGSLVAPDRLRFDFSHFEAVSDDQLVELERLVNAWIRANAAADIRRMGYDEAIDYGAIALFGEKYGDEVRVLRFGDFSTELCGGTHVGRTGDIGFFKIIGESGVAAGIRRIEAITGDEAVAWAEDSERRLDRLAKALKASPDTAEVKLNQLLDRSRQLEKELERLQQKLASKAGADLASQAVDVGGIKVLAAQLDAGQANAMRETVDQLKNSLGSAVVLLAAVKDEKVRLVAGVTKDCTDRVKAGELVNHVAAQVGGKGGGRPDFAQAGGSEPSKLPQALESVVEWVNAKCG
ncbi:alanine--tRNA ligase [Alkalilimnicola ehrlichii]|uniref:Alanine--tRNA ligase n=1 Tax=Alkalilimnicola ehrlichii TaxID=351052 RepID=A0A3E0WN93_9GAMM|nr:alanine--tRNA ligase [Alkalilimnicola ehrlichii]RFA26383.1 alanine--tRNA ligase [Alkalilimnicola ehrlichii]RFA33446.1 alanine--tRNA ligase [Alkalilimnicola ehrlichii]